MSASTELEFKGYQSFDAPLDDPLRSKWNITRLTLGTCPLLFDFNKSLELFNSYVNGEIAYTAEPPGVDIWQAPELTWRIKRGDCEDYAILKYATLLKARFPEDDLRLMVGEIKSAAKENPAHAWCAVRAPERNPDDPLLTRNQWYALDCKFDHLEPVETYVNWIPKIALWGDYARQYGVQTTINEVLDRQSKGMV